MYSHIINAVSLHSRGGLTYLYLLNKYLDKKENILILDSRVRNKFLQFKKAKIFFVRNNIVGILKLSFIRFFFGYKEFFSKKVSKTITEIHLNGRPPLFRFFKPKIYIFFQNKLLIDSEEYKYKISKNNLKIFLYILINKFLFKLLLNKKDIIIVQTNTMHKCISNSFSNKIVLQEEIWGNYNYNLMTYLKNNSNLKNNFFISKIKELKSKNILFFYPAGNYEHKNHERLIQTFSYLNKKHLKNYKLILTIKKVDKFSKRNFDFSNIIYLNELTFKDTLDLYNYIDYLIFPSLSESYGFPLLEANFNNIKIIASDLDFVYDVCQPYLVFDPYDIKDIYKKILPILENK